MRYIAEDTRSIDVESGIEFILENLCIPVTPETLNLIEFIELPGNITLLNVEYPEQEGSYESHFYLKAEAHGEGQIIVGYKNLDTDSISAKQAIQVKVI